VEATSSRQRTGAGETIPSVTAEAGNGGDPEGSSIVCPHFHAAVELVGKRWTGAILWALAEHRRYFAELSAAIPGMSDRLLSRRLRELEAEGVVERSVESGTPARVSYSLTDKGEDLRPAIYELRDWGRRWNGNA
jgi:DNA-binding HxlR family transcriptional regulator